MGLRRCGQLMDRFNRHEFWGMLKVFVWDILIKRLVLVCLPLEMALWVTGKDGPISTLYPTHIAPWLPDSSSWLFWLAPPHFLGAIQWLIYIVFMFFLGRQLLNIYFSDIILRSCMQKRVVGVHRDNKPITSHSCITCYSRKIIWRLQDHGAMVVHLVLGSILFQTLPYYLEGCPVEVWWLLQSYWRGFLYYQYVFTRDGCCPEGMVYAYRYVPIWWAAFQVGAFDTTMDLICDLWIPSKTLYWFIMILLDFLIVLWIQVSVVSYPEPAETHEVFSLNPVWMVWRLAQTVIVGGIGIAKRNPETKTPIHTISMLYLRWKRLWNMWFIRLLRRFLLWPEYRAYHTMVRKGPTAPYFRSQVMGAFQIASSVQNFMKDYDKRLLLLTGITATPIVGSWVRMLLNPQVKNVATLLKKIGPKEVLHDILDKMLEDLQGPLSLHYDAVDPGKEIEQKTVLHGDLKVVRGYFHLEARNRQPSHFQESVSEPQVVGKSSVACQVTLPTFKDPIPDGTPLCLLENYTPDGPTPSLTPQDSPTVLRKRMLEAIQTPL